MRVLVCNAGSSSLKLSLVTDSREADGSVSTTTEDFEDLDEALAAEPDAVAHRVVHGGPNLRGATVVDDDVADELEQLTSLAPLHQPPALEVLGRARTSLPNVPHVACPDTAFHRSLSEEVRTYPVPEAWRTDFGVRRYGFHGLAHGYTAGRVGELYPEARRLVIAHLGSGASLCAVLDGRSVDTTMGFTPEDGLVMGTRAGCLDPGLVTWLSTEKKLPPEDVAHALAKESGLQALAGTSDMREVLEQDGLALAVYLYRLRALLAAMVASLDGLDALVFTGGTGENSPELRRRAVERLGWLGLQLDRERNEAADVDASGATETGTDAGGSHDTADVSAEGATARTLVVHVREDLEAARQIRELLDTQQGRAR